MIRNSFSLDIYSDYKLVSTRLKEVLKKYKIRYLHGYPSLIYDFALYCEQEDSELKEMLSKHLEGAFLGSEFPHKVYRDTIKEVFGILCTGIQKDIGG